MSIRRAWTIFLRQLFLLRRSPYRLFALLYWPVMELFLWGVLSMYFHRTGNDQFPFISILVGAVILYNFLIRIQHGITISFLEDVWVRNFINLFASPLTLVEYILGLLFTSLFQMTISMSFMALLAWLLFSYNIFHLGFWLIPFVIVLFLFGLALGILVTGIILRLGPSSEILTWAIPAIISPLSGVFYPTDLLPPYLQFFSKLLPPTYVFEGLRSVVLRGTFDSQQLVYAVIFTGLWLLASSFFMYRAYRTVLERGVFTRFLSD